MAIAEGEVRCLGRTRRMLLEAAIEVSKRNRVTFLFRLEREGKAAVEPIFNKIFHDWPEWKKYVHYEGTGGGLTRTVAERLPHVFVDHTI